MAFVFITGPMKSGKSLELIARVVPFEYADKKILFVNPKKNVRESNVTSRLGIDASSQVVSSLQEVGDDFDVIGVDEIHKFEEEDAKEIEKWVKKGKDVFISGLDLDYQGHMIQTTLKVLELRPDTIVVKNAVCEVCHTYDARFTQLLAEGKEITEGIPPVNPDDGTFQYEARCRGCFVKK